jgi:hypothetical protein
MTAPRIYLVEVGASVFPFSSDRDPVPQVSDIQVGTPNFGSTQRITAK